MKKILFIPLILLLFNGCVSLSPTYISKQSSLEGYKYVFINPIGEKQSVSGYSNGRHDYTWSNSINPGSLISGYMMNRGFIIVPEVKKENADKTLIINYGEGNARYEGIGNHAIEVTLQFLNAASNDVVCIVRADAIGDNDVNAIINATNKCLDAIFK